MEDAGGALAAHQRMVTAEQHVTMAHKHIAAAREQLALAQEQVRVLLLDTKHRVRACHLVYQGTVNSASIRVAEIVRPAVIANLPAILMVHNHPSGDLTPSPEDLHSTQRIAEAAALLDIDLVDHVILGAAGRYYSLKEAGLVQSPATLRIAA